MGIASGDFDGDGDEDLFVTNIVGETFALYVERRPRRTSRTRGRATGLARRPRRSPDSAPTGSTTTTTAGSICSSPTAPSTSSRRSADSRRPFRMRNQLFHNWRQRRFDERAAPAGPAFARAEIGRGAAFGDIDNDGDVDIVVTNNGGPLRLLLNQRSSRGSHWLQVRLRPAAGQPLRVRRAAIGVERAGRPTLWRRVRTDGSYLSASDVRVHFGLGSTPGVDALLVIWPDGTPERWTTVPTDRVMALERGSGAAR